MVLMGLDHLGGRSGRVFTLTLRDGEWTLDRAAVLDSSPEAWQVVDGHLEVVTEAGLWVVQSDATARLAVPVNFSMAMPRSFAVDADGRRYIGMRRYVLILEPDSPAWRETWYGPPGCPHSRRKNAWKCVCVK